MIAKLFSAGLSCIVISSAGMAQSLLINIPQNYEKSLYFANNDTVSSNLATIQRQKAFIVTSESNTDAREPFAIASSRRWQWPELPDNLSGGISTEFRYDTDANQAAETSTLRPLGAVTPLTPKKQADWSFVTKAELKHTYSSSHPQLIWETNATFSDQRFFHISRNYDFTSVLVDTGPHVAVTEFGKFAVSVRPYTSASWLGYGQYTYATFYGGGLSTRFQAPKWKIDLGGIGRYGNYHDSVFRPNTGDLTGPNFRLFVSSYITINAATSLSGSLEWYRAIGRTRDLNNQGPAANISVTRNITILQRIVQLDIDGSVQQFNFGEPAPDDPSVIQRRPADPSAVRRRDTQWAWGSSLSIPLLPPGHRILSSIRAMVGYQYIHNVSNAFPFNNQGFIVGVKTALGPEPE
jgi:hypothetical protein